MRRKRVMMRAAERSKDEQGGKRSQKQKKKKGQRGERGQTEKKKERGRKEERTASHKQRLRLRVVVCGSRKRGLMLVVF